MSFLEQLGILQLDTVLTFPSRLFWGCDASIGLPVKDLDRFFHVGVLSTSSICSCLMTCDGSGLYF